MIIKNFSYMFRIQFPTKCTFWIFLFLEFMEWHRFGNLSIERPSYYYQLLLLLLLLLLLRTKYAASQEGLMLRASRLNFWAVGGTLKV